jgi:hypothetical protein
MIETLVILALLATTGLAIWRIRAGIKRRSDQLREKFHSEYDRQERLQGRHKAEAELQKRQERVADYSIRALSQAEYDRFFEEWNHVQRQFVDDPKEATTLADRLVKEIMRARGYPMNDFETRAADLSVTHPKFAERYRKARSVAVSAQQGQATTEQLRQATVNYRYLVDELLVSEPVALDQRSARGDVQISG